MGFIVFGMIPTDMFFVEFQSAGARFPHGDHGGQSKNSR